MLAFRQSFAADVLVRTGAFRNDAIAECLDDFRRVYCVGGSESHHTAANERFPRSRHVSLLCGESAGVLRQLAPELAGQSAIYWLDAHWRTPDATSDDHSPCRLLGELEAIGRLNDESVVVIDDARRLLAPPSASQDVSRWPGLQEILPKLVALSDRHRCMVTNDRIVYCPATSAEAIHGYCTQQGVDGPAPAALHDQLAAMERQLEEKEATIQDQALQLIEQEREREDQLQAIRAYRAAFFVFRPILVPIMLARKIAGSIVAPRLGKLVQHAPRRLEWAAEHRVAPFPGAAPKISIVTPSYKQAAFIERTLRSVVSQNYPDLEYIVQDGGSQDGTLGILERYADHLARWESRPDGGQANAINLGFAKSTGEIMAWLNSDDILLPGALNHVADFFDRHSDIDVVYGHRYLINEDDRLVGRWVMPPHNDRVLSWADYIPQETLFWRRRIWDRVGGRIDESFAFAMDWDLLVRFRDAGARFARIPRFLGGFRVHPQQKTSARISRTGVVEMNRIRQRALGRVPTESEKRRALLPYLLRHVVADLGYRVRKLIGSPRS